MRGAVVLGLLLIAGCERASAPPAPAAPPPAPAAEAHETTPTPAGAAAFLSGIYKTYYGKPGQELTWPEPSKLYDKTLLKLMAEDRDLAGEDIGYLDFDPLCECQDPDGLTGTIAETAGDASRATVKVKIDSPEGAHSNYHTVITIELTYEDGHWRIHDTVHEGTSLRQALEASNARMRKEKG